MDNFLFLEFLGEYAREWRGKYITFYFLKDWQTRLENECVGDFAPGAFENMAIALQSSNIPEAVEFGKAIMEKIWVFEKIIKSFAPLGEKEVVEITTGVF